MTRSRSCLATLVVSLSLGVVACGDAASSGGAESATSGTHPLVGSAAPEFSIATADKKGRVNLGALRGKVVIVDFWATWCEPCKKSFPKLQDVYTKYKASGVEVVGISEDDEADGIREFGQNLGAKFPLGWDADKSIAGKWQPKTMPSTFIVDKTGVIRFAHVGYHDGDEAELDKEIKSLLQ